MDYDFEFDYLIMDDTDEIKERERRVTRARRRLNLTTMMFLLCLLEVFLSSLRR